MSKNQILASMPVSQRIEAVIPILRQTVQDKSLPAESGNNRTTEPHI